MNKITGVFCGTIDDLLKHCENLDTNMSNDELHQVEQEAGIKHIMEVLNLDYNEAKEVHSEIARLNILKAIQQLLDEGVIEIKEYDENGDPLYVLAKPPLNNDNQ
jgi:metal-dependent HD superfamily phosphatase/phosphodiesterase